MVAVKDDIPAHVEGGFLGNARGDEVVYHPFDLVGPDPLIRSDGNRNQAEPYDSRAAEYELRYLGGRC